MSDIILRADGSAYVSRTDDWSANAYDNGEVDVVVGPAIVWLWALIELLSPTSTGGDLDFSKDGNPMIDVI